MMIPICTDQGMSQRDMPVAATPVPGLVIHKAPGAKGWMLAHEPSGSGVGWFPHADPEAVLAAALDLAQVADWTLPPGDLSGYAASVREVITRWGGRFYTPRIVSASGGGHA